VTWDTFPSAMSAMSDTLRYLAEEVGIDHADGHITRREAVRRLSLLGFSAAAAATLLSACSKTKAPDDAATPTNTAPTAPASSAAPTSLPAALPTTAVTFPGPDGRTLQGAFASPPSPTAALLVIHENKGLTEHIRQVAGRFAHRGYAALAIDLLSEEGGTASLGDQANATAALGKVEPARFVADLQAGLAELTKRAPGKKIGAIGFCFGGGMTWRLLASKDPRLAAGAPFYGPFPDGADFQGSPAEVLGVFAEKDDRVNKTREAAQKALEAAKVPHEIVTFPGVDHAFFNDTGPRYDATQASAAFDKVLVFFGKALS
jgi:carboxymethylenebutenolidase